MLYNILQFFKKYNYLVIDAFVIILLLENFWHLRFTISSVNKKFLSLLMRDHVFKPFDYRIINNLMSPPFLKIINNSHVPGI